jgi:hypothetical protein
MPRREFRPLVARGIVGEAEVEMRERHCDGDAADRERLETLCLLFERIENLRVTAGNVEIGAAWQRTSKDTPCITQSSSTTRPSRRRSTPTSWRSTKVTRWSGRADALRRLASREARRLFAHASGEHGLHLPWQLQ